MGNRGWRLIACGAFVIFVCALIALTGLGAGWWEALGEEDSPAWTRVERVSWVAGILGLLVTCLSLWQSARALSGAIAYPEPGRGDGREELPTPPATAQSAEDRRTGRRSGLLDRRKERAELEERLRDCSGGVVVVRGPEGIGKSKLVKVVLEDLERKPQSGDGPRIYRCEAVPDTRLDLKTFIDHLESETGTTADIRPGESSLARFKLALEALGDKRVVIAVECAENLVERNKNHLVDYDLDEAFEILANGRHRVVVLLVTRVVPESRESRTWPSEAQVINVPRLPRDEFIEYLEELDRNDVLDLRRSPDVLDAFYEQLQGNLRLAEILYAILVGDGGVGVETLAKKLSGLPYKDVRNCLTELLVENLRAEHRRVVEVLAAYATPVEAAAVAELLSGEPSPDKVEGALTALEYRRVVHRTSDGRYRLPAGGVDWEPEDDEARVNLLKGAAQALWLRRSKEPRGLDDLSLHFASLRAVLRARRYAWAYERIYFIDQILRKWNCQALLIGQRKEIRGRTEDERYEMGNENALGDLYARRGRWNEADAAYGRALQYSEGLGESESRMRIRANIAMLYWQQDRIETACEAYGLVLQDVRDGGDPRVRLSALEGLADCHRRWGLYDEAIFFARKALEVPDMPDYPYDDDALEYASSRTVRIALKLVRWYSELGLETEAQRFLKVAEEEKGKSPDGSAEMAYLEGRAGFLLDAGDFAGAVRDATASEEKALRVHDPVGLLQARTTLCFAHLAANEYFEAAQNLEGALRYREEGRSLIVLALDALVTRRQLGPVQARKKFGELEKSATRRVKADERDFTAWDFKAFALCGRLLSGSADLSEPVQVFLKAGKIPARSTPGLARRMNILLRELEKSVKRPGILNPVIEAVNERRARPLRP